MDSEKINEGKTLITEVIKEYDSNIDTSVGTAVETLVINPYALGYAFLNEKTESFNNNNSISRALENADSLDDGAVDALMSNWGASRIAGAYPTGNLKVTVNTSKQYSIAEGTVFTYNDKKYYTVQDYVITADQLVEDEDNYYFIVSVKAAEALSSYNVLAGAVFEYVIYTLNAQSVVALSDFTVASEEQSSEDLLNSMEESLTTRDFVSRKSINKLLKDQFSEIDQLSVLGYNDREQQRDVNNLGFKVGGKVDILFRKKNIDRLIVSATADSNGLIDLSSVEYPILKIVNYAQQITPTRYIKNDIDFYCESSNNNLTNNQSRFSSYENIFINSVYTDKDVYVTLEVNTLCKEVQDYIDDEDLNNIIQDTLAKSFFPCYISLNLEYTLKEGKTIDTSLLISGIIEYINSYTDTEFYVSKLVNYILQNNSEIDSLNLPVEITADFALPDCTTITTTGTNKIVAPEDYVLGVSSKTFKFYSNSDLITVKEI